MLPHATAPRRPTDRVAAVVRLAILAASLLFVSCRAVLAPDSGGTSAAPERPTAAEPAGGELRAENPTAPTAPPAPTGTNDSRAQVIATAAAEATARLLARLPAVEFTFGQQGTEPGQLYLPVDVGVDGADNIYVSDSTGVQKFGPEGEFLLRVGVDAVKVAQGIAVSPNGAVYVSGLGGMVLVFDAAGHQTGTIGEPGREPGQLLDAVDVALDAAGDVYVADTGNWRVEKFAPNGTHLLSIGERGMMSGQFTTPRIVTVDALGRIYVGMGDDFIVQRFSADGTYLDAMGQSHLNETMWRIAGLVTDANGNLYVSEAVGHKLQSFELEDRGRLRWEYGVLGRQPGEFNTPGGMTVSDNRLYIADTNNSRIQVLRLP